MVDHAFGPLSEDDDVVEGVCNPLGLLSPFVTVGYRCLLSVMMASGFEGGDEVGWRRYLRKVSELAVRMKMSRYSYLYRDIAP